MWLNVFLTCPIIRSYWVLSNCYDYRLSALFLTLFGLSVSCELCHNYWCSHWRVLWPPLTLLLITCQLAFNVCTFHVCEPLGFVSVLIFHLLFPFVRLYITLLVRRLRPRKHCLHVCNSCVPAMYYNESVGRSMIRSFVIAGTQPHNSSNINI